MFTFKTSYNMTPFNKVVLVDHATCIPFSMYTCIHSIYCILSSTESVRTHFQNIKQHDTLQQGRLSSMNLPSKTTTNDLQAIKDKEYLKMI